MFIVKIRINGIVIKVYWNKVITKVWVNNKYKMTIWGQMIEVFISYSEFGFPFTHINFFNSLKKYIKLEHKFIRKKNIWENFYNRIMLNYGFL